MISQSVANKMTSMMLGTFSNGSAVDANAYGYTIAGKTGTVEASFNADLTSDQWVYRLYARRGYCTVDWL